MEPMGILRARRDIEQDTEILTRYWRNKKDAWQNIFKCECCACTNKISYISDPLVTTEPKSADETAPGTGHPPNIGQDLTKEHQKLSQDNLAGNKQEYPDSEIDAWDWDELEASSPIRTFQPMQSLTTLPPTWGDEGTSRDPGHNVSLDHKTYPLHNMCPLPLYSMTQRMASVPDQSFPKPWQPVVGALVTVDILEVTPIMEG